MSRSAQEIIAPVITATERGEQRFVSDLMMLTKARLSMLVLVTTGVGFCMNSGAQINWMLLLHTLFGTALVTASAAILNQVIETKFDRLMERTRHRPLPSGRMKSSTATALGIVLAVVGFLYLAWMTNLLAANLAAATNLIYLFFYTPLKRKTSYCVMVGAVSGALPPVIGWAAADPTLGAGAWILFGVLFFWQMPHFLAIAWMYRDEYAQAGFIMLRKNDVGGMNTARTSFLFTLALLVVTMLPVVLQAASPLYLVGAALCDALLLLCAIQFLFDRSRPVARRLFFASIIFLPCLLGLMVLTRA